MATAKGNLDQEMQNLQPTKINEEQYLDAFHTDVPN